MRILLATGIYPPEVGGPAYYAENLKKSFERQGHRVSVKTYGIENSLPTGIRHIWYFCRIFFEVFSANVVLALDTYSAGFPAVVASMFLRTPIVIRVGGDFFWEQYVERTQEPVLLSEFYLTKHSFTLKERVIFGITKWLLHYATCVVFSTQWQRELWKKPYSLEKTQTICIENAYPERIHGASPHNRHFIASGRERFLKNFSALKKAFRDLQKKYSDVKLDTEPSPHALFLEKIRSSYAVIVPSLSEISPNLILEAIQYGKPFITTKDNGLMDRIGDIGIFIDTRDERALTEALEKLLDPAVYKEYCHRVESFTYTRTYDDIAEDFLSLFKHLCTS